MRSWSIPQAVRLTADIARHPGLRETLAALLVAPLPAVGCSSGPDPLILWQGPKDWLILCKDAAALAKRLDGCRTVIATPAALAEFNLSAGQLATGTAVRPSNGDVTVTRFAQLRVTVLAENDRYRLFVEAHVARHISLWLEQS